MDYLLRDSLNTGVPYGIIDMDRIVNCLRIFCFNEGKNDEDNMKYAIGVNQRDKPLIESRFISRQLIYSQVYHHPISKLYDEHLKDFMKEWVKPTQIKNLSNFVKLTDTKVISEVHKQVISSSIKDEKKRLRELGNRIAERGYYKFVHEEPYQKNILGEENNFVDILYKTLCKELGDDNVIKVDISGGKKVNFFFPIKLKNGKVITGGDEYDFLKNILGNKKKRAYFYVHKKDSDKVKNIIKKLKG